MRVLLPASEGCSRVKKTALLLVPVVLGVLLTGCKAEGESSPAQPSVGTIDRPAVERHWGEMSAANKEKVCKAVEEGSQTDILKALGAAGHPGDEGAQMVPHAMNKC